METCKRFRGALLGLAAGDAVGTTVEFMPRGSFDRVTDMVGGGPFGLAVGQWTDDTSMALCLAASLIETQGFDPRDQMRRYCDWHENGYMSSTGICFDIGNTVRQALDRYRRTGEPFSGSSSPETAGNGSIMRLAPVPMFFYGRSADIVHYCAESSRTTHATAECLDACRVFGQMISRALDGASKDQVLLGGEIDGITSPKIAAIARGEYRRKKSDEITGNGYVVNSLEAALWCFSRGNSYEEAILRSANLGDDADTTAAICGQLAGAHYGEDGIPERWRAKLTMRDRLIDFADRLFEAGCGLTNACS